MTHTNRITPADIPALFQKLGMKPNRWTYGDGKSCGCLTTALAVDAGVTIGQRYPWDACCLVSRGWAELHFGEGYATGLVRGWDSGLKKAECFLGERQQQGIADAAEAARLVFGEAAQ